MSHAHPRSGERRFTLVLLSHRSGRTASLTCSRALARFVAAAAALAAVSVLVVALGVCSRTWEAARGRRLERVHLALAGEVARLGRRADALADSLARLSREDDEMRLVAGLDPVKPEVGRAGIGGPVLPWPERDHLLADGGAQGRLAFDLQVRLAALLRQASIVTVSLTEAGDSLSAHLREWAATPTVMPTPGFINSRFAFARFHPILRRILPHEGVDIGAPEGARVLAPAAGRVVEVGRDPWNGLMVVLDHGYGLTTRYAHLSRAATSVGARVERGDLLGFVGATGLATGPHLHYEVRLHGRAVDPLGYVLPEGFAD